MTVNTPHTPLQIELVRIIEDHNFEWDIEDDVVHVHIPWSRRQPGGHFESGVEREDVLSIPDLRCVLGY